MSTVNRTIETEHDKDMAARLIEARSLPFTLTLTDGKHRSTAQNKLQHKWMQEIAEQKGDMKPDEVRAYCKLTIGVPLLRDENEAFRIGYDEVVRPLPYEHKLAIMKEPLDLPVTRLMTTKQKTEYLDRIARHFGEQGIVLTMPENASHPDSHTGAAPSAPVDDEPSPGSSSDASAPSSPSPDAAEASSIHTDWLLNVARMLWAATNYGGPQDLLIRQKVAAIAAFPKPADCPRVITGKAEAVFNYCKRIVEGSITKEDGKALVAGVALCDQDDLDGRAA